MKSVIKILCCFIFCYFIYAYAQEVEQTQNLEITNPVPGTEESVSSEPATSAAEQEAAGLEVSEPTAEAKPEEQVAAVDSLAKSQNVTLDFKDADIRNVLKIISYKSGINIVTTPEVMGNVTIRLIDVPWENALDVILKTYGFAYEKKGNVITVAPLEKLTALKKQEVELSQVQPTVTEVFNLRFIDAQDAKKALDSQLSPRGKITVLEVTGQSGWKFGTEELGKRERVTEKSKISRSKTLIVTDIPPNLDKIKAVVEKIDVMPKQILIEAKLVEVNHDKLKQIGFNWSTGVPEGTAGYGYSVPPVHLTTHRNLYSWYEDNADGEQKEKKGIAELPMTGLSGGQAAVGTQFIPEVGVYEFVFQKLTGTKFEAIFKAIEETGDANILSAPHILTINNQEASILVGQKFPLLKSTVSTETGTITGTTLDRYQDIGIQLNVIPQISGVDSINLIIHPAVSSYTTTIEALSSTGQKMAEYPVILTREADTQLLIKDGETVVMGGLMTDDTTVEISGVPILKDIPILGVFFKSRKVTHGKIDLLVFITARIIKDGEFSPAEINKLEERVTNTK